MSDISPANPNQPKLLLKMILNGVEIIKDLDTKEIQIFRRYLFSSNSVERKITALLILYLSYEDKSFAKTAVENGLLTQIGDYFCISITQEYSLESREEMHDCLLRDPKFKQDETKSNKLLVKSMLKEQDSSLVKLDTLTELRHYLRVSRYNKIPDPLNCVLWFFKCKKKILMLNFFGFNDKNGRRRMRGLKKASRAFKMVVERKRMKGGLSKDKNEQEKGSSVQDSLETAKRAMFKIERRRHKSFKLSKNTKDHLAEKLPNLRKKISMSPEIHRRRLNRSSLIDRRRTRTRTMSTGKNTPPQKKSFTSKSFLREGTLDSESTRTKNKRLSIRNISRIRNQLVKSFHVLDKRNPAKKGAKGGSFFFKKIRRRAITKSKFTSDQTD